MLTSALMSALLVENGPKQLLSVQGGTVHAITASVVKYGITSQAESPTNTTGFEKNPIGLKFTP